MNIMGALNPEPSLTSASVSSFMGQAAADRTSEAGLMPAVPAIDRKGHAAGVPPSAGGSSSTAGLLRTGVG